MDTEKKRKRMALIAVINGGGMLLMAVLCLVPSLLSFSVGGILAGLMLLASACMELNGRRLLKQQKTEARRWLAWSQLVILIPVVLYCAYSILTFDAQKLVIEMKQAAVDASSNADLRREFVQAVEQPEVQDMVIKAFRYLYPSLIGATLLYQGGLWLYYTLGTRALERAAAETPKE